MKIKVGILGATGYTGAELLRLLVSHPGVEILWLTSEKFAGKRIWEVFPSFRNFLDLKCLSASKLGELDKVDLAFSCLPHGTSMHFTKRLLDAGARVIDFSGDFRLKDKDTYETWYRLKHSHQSLLKEAVYGLPELYRESIKNARLIANPGCYSTSALLGILPLMPEGIVAENSFVIDSKSGLTGGGRAPTLEHHFSETNESISANSVTGHNQKPEIEQELSSISGSPSKVTFIPHSIPANRGILTTIYCKLKEIRNYKEIRSLYSSFYKGKPFIRIYEKELFPLTKNVSFSNFCDIGFGFQEDTLVIITALDNLGKGASGQAVQNMNIMFDFREDEGLRIPGMYP